MFDVPPPARQPARMTMPNVPPGFEPLSIASPYARALGPLHVDREGARLGLATTDTLANIAGVVHGGALATLADVALFIIGGKGELMTDAVTLTLNASFVAPARLGRFLVASGRIVREGRSVLFVDGEVTDEGETVLTFSGTLKRVRPRTL